MHLPEDVIRNILRRLAVKSLLRFTSVSSPWRDIILSDQFIDSHTKFGHRMEIVISSEINLDGYSEIRRPEISDHVILQSYFQSIALSKTILLNEYYQVIGHCMGIICLKRMLTTPATILLWNPALRQCRALPPTGFYPDSIGFGYDAYNQDYKVVISSCDFSRVMLYSLNNESLKSIDRSSYFKLRRNEVAGLFFEGRVYWIGYKLRDDYGLLVFDLTKEEFLQFDLSDTFDKRDHYIERTLGILNGYISLLTDRRDFGEHNFEIWSMADHFIPQSWIKAADSSSMMLDVNQVFLKYLGLGIPWSAGITRDGKLFADISKNGESHLLLYNVATHKLDVHSRRRLGSRNMTGKPRIEFEFYPITDFFQTLVRVIPKSLTLNQPAVCL